MDTAVVSKSRFRCVAEELLQQVVSSGALRALPVGVFAISMNMIGLSFPMLWWVVVCTGYRTGTLLVPPKSFGFVPVTNCQN
jgi:hypothetical protein